MKLWMKKIIAIHIAKTRHRIDYNRRVKFSAFRTGLPQDRNRDFRAKEIRKQLAGPRHKWPTDIRTVVRAAYDLFANIELERLAPEATPEQRFEIAERLLEEFCAERAVPRRRNPAGPPRAKSRLVDVYNATAPRIPWRLLKNLRW